ncbi:MAG: hypothetical protein D3904_08895 [Candidatus Electrothrix sp. EH2]|nr:hypothetical protein [Candidatus Electrothrix sp. EH2]
MEAFFGACEADVFGAIISQEKISDLSPRKYYLFKLDFFYFTTNYSKKKRAGRFFPVFLFFAGIDKKKRFHSP